MAEMRTSVAIAEAIEFRAGLVLVAVPAGAKVGDSVTVSLARAQRGALTMPWVPPPGAKFEVRPAATAYEEHALVVKKDGRLGVQIRGAVAGEDVRPYVSAVDEGACAHGILQPGDVLSFVKCTTAKSSVNEEAKTAQGVCTLLRDALGQMELTVARPLLTPLSVIVLKGFLNKRSPKSFVGVHAWQQRWFELTPDRIVYFETVSQTKDGQATAQPQEKGSIALLELKGAREVRTNEKRFDLLRKDERLFQLLAPTKEERVAWMDAIGKAIMGALQGSVAAASLSEAPPPAPLSAAASGAGDLESVEQADADAEADDLSGREEAVESRAYSVSVSEPAVVEGRERTASQA